MDPNRQPVPLTEAAALLQQAQSLVFLTHRSPDGDSIGSATALAAALQSHGKAVTIVCPDPLPDYLLAIPGAPAVVNAMPDGPCDLVVAIDVSDPRLLVPLPAADAAFFAHRPSLNLDHHASNLHFARYNYVDPQAAAASEIVAALAALLDVRLTPDLATDVLYGIVNDTHSFQNSNTTPHTLRLSAAMVEAGADLASIVYQLLLARRMESARLWALVLPTLSTEDHDRVAFLTVSLAAQDASGATLVDADGLVEFLRNIRGVDLAVLFKEVAPDAYKLSLRTTEAVDATVVAGAFGGGGHKRASGCEARGSLPAIRETLLAAYFQARPRTA
jgi:phosphoesterase RecJ-like protein